MFCMINYRKILELHDDGISLRGIAASTGHSRQKVTRAIDLAKEKGLVCPLDEEMTDKWIEDFLFPEKSQEGSGRQALNFDYIHRELAKPSADGSYRKLIKKYAKVDLLILDEWLLTELTTDEATILLEITESRHKAASTIFCSQIDPSGWHTKLGNETIAEAILDRIIHGSYQILIDGEISMRERYGLGK